MQENNDYELDPILENLFIAVYTQPTYIKLKNIYRLLNSAGYQIDSLILDKINNDGIDDSNVGNMIMYTTKESMVNLLKENNILIDMASLDVLNNVIYTIYTITEQDPSALVPYSDVLNNDDLSNIDKLANIVDMYTPSTYNELLDYLEYVSEDIITSLENNIDELIDLEENSDTSVLSSYYNLLYTMTSRDPHIKNTVVYSMLSNGTISNNLIDNTTIILKYVDLYKEGDIKLETLCNIIIVYLIVTEEDDLYNLYLNKVVEIILQDEDEEVINKITNYINNNLNIVLGELNKE